MVSYYLGPTEHEYTKKKFFSPRLKFRKNSVYHASDKDSLPKSLPFAHRRMRKMTVYKKEEPQN